MATTVAELAAKWFGAWRVKDASAVESMMGADYVYVAPNGAVMDRAAILAIINDPTYGIEAGEHTGVKVVPLVTDVSLVLHRWTGRGSLGGRSFVDDHRCMMIWCRTNAGWEVRYEQASPISD